MRKSSLKDWVNQELDKPKVSQPVSVRLERKPQEKAKARRDEDKSRELTPELKKEAQREARQGWDITYYQRKSS